MPVFTSIYKAQALCYIWPPQKQPRHVVLGKKTQTESISFLQPGFASFVAPTATYFILDAWSTEITYP